MTTPEEQPTVGDFLARLEFKYDNDVLDFLKTGKGVVVVEDKIANIPLPKGEPGEKGDIGQLREGDVRYFNHRTNEAVKAAEEASESAESAKQDEVTTRGHREHIDAQRQHVDAQKDRVDESAEKADADEKSAKASAEQAARDRAQTGADRTQTGLDRQAAQQARQHIDAQRQHFDGHIEHIDSQVEHVDAQAEHVDEQTAIATTKAEEASVSATSAQEAADRLGSAEMIEGWVSSAEASADTASDAADEATSAVRAEVDKLVAGAPEAFDTLKEIADELEKNETERAALANSIGEKARREEVDAALDLKSDVGHIHSVSEVDGLEARLEEAGKTVEWGQVSGKPTTFPSEGHGHQVDDVDGLGTALAGAGQTAQWGQVSGKPSAFPPEGHRHTTDHIDNLDALIDERAGVLVREAIQYVGDGEGVYVGDGFPERKVTAPVGAIYTDRQATAGAIRWIKTRGTGNIGWEVEYGKIIRNINDILVNGWVPEVSASTWAATLSRTLNTVEFRGYLSRAKGPATSDEILLIPEGFRPPATLRAHGVANGTTQTTTHTVRVNRTTIAFPDYLSGQSQMYIHASWQTDDPWPSILPGTPT